MAERHSVQLRTERFRNGLDPLWVRVRHLLIERDFDPLSMALAYFEQEDFKFRFGVFVNADGRVYQFGFDFAGKKCEEGRFSEWQDITETWGSTPFRQSVTEALAFLEREKKRSGR